VGNYRYFPENQEIIGRVRYIVVQCSNPGVPAEAKSLKIRVQFMLIDEWIFISGSIGYIQSSK
jgi:hypothetical protein